MSSEAVSEEDYISGSESDYSYESGSKDDLGSAGSDKQLSFLEEDKHHAIRLEDQMNNEHLEVLQRIFEEADEDGGGGLDYEEFRRAMIKTMSCKEVPDDNQLAITFMKVDANCDGTVDWEEFCSYMLLENQLKDVMTSDEREMEFPHPAREIPSAHRDNIARITYFAKMSHGPDESGDNNVGRYVTVSREGVLHFWSMDLNPIRTITVSNASEGKASKSVWITDCVVLPNAKKIAVSSADREIAFYDCSANSVEKQFVLSGLENCALCMDYWYDPRHPNQSILLFGDSGGKVSCIKFSAVNLGLFDLNIGQTIPSVTCRRIPFPELVLGRHPNVKAVQFTGLHNDWVRKVKYYPTLQCFISCATSSENSMYLGDVDRKKTCSMFRTRKGITSFDYCKEWNVIVTGGLDHYVRLWNPYVTSKSTSVLKGHSATVTHILVNSEKGEIISVAQDKVIKIWDMRDLCCVQTIPARSLLPGPHIISSIYFHPKAHCILVGTNQLSVLEGKNDEPSEECEIMSHTKPLCAALYNDLFDQVVSACHESVVCVWSLETGEKIIQFSNAHDDSEITAMSFDPSKRRLVTGARDGSVKIWNFNNGACLRVLHQVDDEEITGILCHKQHIITVGWSKNVIFHRNCRDDEEDVPRVWRAFHADDILSIALYHPSLVATSSYDGCVKIWNADTGHMSCLLNTNKYHSNTAGVAAIPLDLKRRISQNNALLSACVASSRLSQGHRPSSRSASRSGNRRSSLFRDPTLIAMSRPNSRLITPILPDIEVRESDHDSVVENVLFLQKRESHRQTATLVTSGSGGWVRLWTLFGGELLGQFMAAQSGKESVTALTTDSDNTMLVTADTLGYVRVWDISCYYIKESEKPPPKENPEERSDEDKHRQSAARRRANLRRDNLPLKIGNVSCVPPPLLCKFRAHLMCVVSLDFVSGKNLIVTASTDCSARLWTSAGRYVGTFGQKVLWDIERAIKGRAKLPHDILRNASPDTLKSLGTSGTYKWRRIAKQILNIANIGRHLTTKMADTSFDQQALEPSIKESMRNVLGKYYQPKTRHRLLPPIQRPRFNHNQVVVYSSLPYKDLETVDDANLSFVLGHPGEKSSLYSLRDGTESRGRTVKMGAPPSTTPKSQGPRTPASRGSDSRKGRTHV